MQPRDTVSEAQMETSNDAHPTSLKESAAALGLAAVVFVLGFILFTKPDWFL